MYGLQFVGSFSMHIFFTDLQIYRFTDLQRDINLWPHLYYTRVCCICGHIFIKVMSHVNVHVNVCIYGYMHTFTFYA